MLAVISSLLAVGGSSGQKVSAWIAIPMIIVIGAFALFQFARHRRS